MGLVALEFFKGRQPRVLVCQAHHEADCHQVFAEVIEEGPAVGVILKWPAGGMDHQSLAMFGRLDFPEFLDADAISLGVAVGIELEARDQLFAQMATRAFSKERVLREQFHAGLKV